MLTIPRGSEPEVKEFVKQMVNAYKVLETNKRTGAKAYRYKGKREHYRNAMNYFLLAASSHRLRVATRYKKEVHADVISEYERV